MLEYQPNLPYGKSLLTKACIVSSLGFYRSQKWQKQRQFKTSKKTSESRLKPKSKTNCQNAYSGPSEFSFCFFALRNSSTVSHLFLVSRDCYATLSSTYFAAFFAILPSNMRCLRMYACRTSWKALVAPLVARRPNACNCSGCKGARLSASSSFLQNVYLVEHDAYLDPWLSRYYIRSTPTQSLQHLNMGTMKDIHEKKV